MARRLPQPIITADLVSAPIAPVAFAEISPHSIDALQKVHSITSSASASTLFGTVKSIALAVFKLMTNK